MTKSQHWKYSHYLQHDLNIRLKVSPAYGISFMEYFRAFLYGISRFMYKST